MKSLITNITVFLFLLTISGMLLAQPGNTGNQLATSTNPAKLKLAPIFVSDDGGLVYMRELDGNVYWFAEHPGRDYAHIFHGKRNGTRIHGQIISVPKYAATTVAQISMEVRTGGVLHQLAGGDKLPFHQLSPRALSEVQDRLPSPTFPAYQAQGADFDGGYKDERGRQFYVRTLDDKVVFFVESEFIQGKRPVAAFVYIGSWTGPDKRFSSGKLIALPKGQRKSHGRFSLGFLDDKKLSGKSDFAHLKTVLAEPIKKPGSGTSPVDSAAVFPALPRWIKLTSDHRVIVDFGTIIDEHPLLSLPVDSLPKWLPIQDGQPVIPDNFCGLSIRNAGSIQWQDGERVVTDENTYNHVKDLEDADESAYFEGIRFDGPIGKCAGSEKGWRFFAPITKHGGESTTPGLKLVIDEVYANSIDFINYQIIHGKPLSPDKLFKEKTYEEFKKKLKSMESLGKYEGYCEFDDFVEKVCDSPNPQDPFPPWPASACPVSKDFVSPC